MNVNKSSNHPPNILKQIPIMTGKRLSNLSCNEEEFKKAAPEYEEVLKTSGFNEKLVYSTNGIRRNQRKRNIIWYNPPFEMQVKTKVARIFLTLVKKHFPPNHKLYKVINKDNVKVSYSCMPNVGAYISSHNIALMNKSRSTEETPREQCNCNNREACPLNGQCKSEAIIYQGTIETPQGESSKYIGLTEPAFKLRWSDHMSSCNNRSQMNKTKLSQEFWRIKDSGQNLDRHQNVKFSIVKKSSPYRIGSKKCNLCLWEKLMIMKNEQSLINKRDEFISKCRHTSKFILNKFKSGIT